MRVKCYCGKIAGYWYSPVVYKKLDFNAYLNTHAFCEEHADIDNWAEYMYIGFHKTRWQWLTKKGIVDYLLVRNERLSLPYYDVSHVRDGKRWGLGRYHDMESVVKETEGLEGVEIEEGWYR